MKFSWETFKPGLYINMMCIDLHANINTMCIPVFINACKFIRVERNQVQIIICVWGVGEKRTRELNPVF